jgi:hypothetical protein
MDFAPGLAFDEQDRLNALEKQRQQEVSGGEEKKPWLKRAAYVIFG